MQSKCPIQIWRKMWILCWLRETLKFQMNLVGPMTKEVKINLKQCINFFSWNKPDKLTKLFTKSSTDVLYFVVVLFKVIWFGSVIINNDLVVSSSLTFKKKGCRKIQLIQWYFLQWPLVKAFERKYWWLVCYIEKRIWWNVNAFKG